jgi:hypothetical protein
MILKWILKKYDAKVWDRFHLAQDRAQRRALVDTMSPRIIRAFKYRNK